MSSHLAKVAAVAAVLVVQMAGPVLAQREILPFGSKWRYLDDGSDQGTTWREEGFDDSSWIEGTASFGFGDQDINWEIDRKDAAITYYFRTRIEVAGKDDTLRLRLSYLRDDGLVVYINGEEVHRDNIPAGEVTAATLASVSVDGTRERAANRAFVPANYIRDGVNTIAVEIHQASPSSSDIRFDLQLFLADPLQLPERTLPMGTGFENPNLADPLFSASFPDGLLDLPIVNRGLLQGEPLDSNQLVVSDSRFRLDSVPFSVVGFSDIQAVIDVRTESFDRGFVARDYLRVEWLVCLDGETFETYRGIDLKGSVGVVFDWMGLVTDETPKKAQVPTGALNPPPEWRLANFDDSSWLEGNNGIGYDSPGGSFMEFVGIDIREQMRGINGAVYLRAPFTIGNLAEADAFRLRIRYDDGFVAFLNGVELARENAPENVQWNSTATTSHSDALAVAYSDYDVSEHLSVLHEGENVLSVIGLNKAVGGSDVLLSPLLETGVVSEDQQRSLSAMDRGPNGSFTTLVSDRHSIPLGAAVVKLRLEARVGILSAIYFDKIRITGVPMFVDSLENYLTSTTDWLLGDVRRGPDVDPDGDGSSNLLEYAFQTDPSSRNSGGAGLPQLNLNQGGSVTLTYAQIDGATEGAPNQGYRVHDLIYVPQISVGDLDAEGKLVWIGGRGEELFEESAKIEKLEGTDLVRVSLRLRQPIAVSSRQVFARMLILLDE